MEKRGRGDGSWTCRRYWFRNWTSSSHVKTMEGPVGGRGINIPPLEPYIPKEATWFSKTESKPALRKGCLWYPRTSPLCLQPCSEVTRACILEQGQPSSPAGEVILCSQGLWGSLNLNMILLPGTLARTQLTQWSHMTLPDILVLMQYTFIEVIYSVIKYYG